MAERSPTETLIKAMEEVGKEDAQELLVIMTSKDGGILTLCTSTRSTVKLGLMETAKQWIAADTIAEALKGG